MKTKKILTFFTYSVLTASLLSCQEMWEDHYNSTEISSDEFTVWSGDIESYIKSQTDLTSIAALLEEQGMFEKTLPENEYTYIVYNNDLIAGGLPVTDSIFVKNCVSEVSVSPSKLVEGFGIKTLLGKNIWIYQKDDSIFFDNFRMSKRIKANNGFIYYVDGIIPIRPSIYEKLKSLGSEYSDFVSLVKKYEEIYFDKESSTPSGVDPMGNTIYSDSVMATRNTLMDRYTENGIKIWDMRSESYVTTMFIPNNLLVRNAIKTALNNIPIWLGRKATAADTTKFEEWIVKACFSDKRLSDEQVLPTGSDFDCVGGYYEKIDKTQDVELFKSIDPARWRPSVQTVDLSSKVPLSNGEAFYLTNLKIPNHVVIYRVKSKFYQLWTAMTTDQQNKYFRWTNWTAIKILNSAQSEFQLSTTLPPMIYDVLTAIPSTEAIADSSVCSVEYDGLLINSGNVTEAYLPAGEYNLRMGFKHSLRYSINILFNDSIVAKHMMLYAQGSNFHFDRGSAGEMGFYSTSAIGYPEGFDWKDWVEKDVKAVAYDTDGYQVAVVNIPQDGNFKIKIESEDESYLFRSPTDRSVSNVTQLMMYHWCLRPTLNNY